MSKDSQKLDKPVVPIKKQLETLDEIKEAMLMACKIMDTFGLVQGFGHVSSRLPNTTNILVTPPRPLGQLKEEDLVIMDAEGTAEQYEKFSAIFNEYNEIPENDRRRIRKALRDAGKIPDLRNVIETYKANATAR